MARAYSIGPKSLRYVCPNLSHARAKELAGVLGPAMKLAGATTERRAAALIAQWAHECDRFRTREEYASGAAYEGRRDLGNIKSGDGRRYKGRGFIQVTGRTNYRLATQRTEALWKSIRGLFPAVAHRKAAPDFEAHPKLIGERDTWAAVASALWWRAADCNAYADRGDFKGLTRRINGGYTGLADREELHRRALRVARYLVPTKR